MGMKKSIRSGLKLFSGSKKKILEDDIRKKEEETILLQAKQEKEAKEREYFERKRKREEEIIRIETEKRARRRQQVEDAKEKWKQEIQTDVGRAYLDRIQKHWNEYTQLYMQRNQQEIRVLCEFAIMSYLLKDPGNIKQLSDLTNSQELSTISAASIGVAIDQLLIKRMVMLAVEGSIEYYRINLRWNIMLEMEQLRRQIAQHEQKVNGTYNEVQETEPTLQSVTTVKMDKDEVTRRFDAYNQLVEGEIITCMRKWHRPMTVYDIATYGSNGELGRMSQFKLEEILRTLVHKGNIQRIEGEYSVKYILVE